MEMLAELLEDITEPDDEDARATMDEVLAARCACL